MKCHIIALFARIRTRSPVRFSLITAPHLVVDSNSLPLTAKQTLTVVAVAFWIGMISPAALPSPAAAAGLSGKAGPFKVVKPPARGARKRITIHNGTRPTVTKRAPRSQNHAWFWEVASPSRSAANEERAGRLAAIAASRLSTSGKANRIAKIADEFSAEISVAAGKSSISPKLLMAVIAAESGGNPKAVSSAGAQGLAQLIPATAERFGVLNAFDPGQNLSGAARYLSVLLGMFDDDVLLALAGYNAGENAVIKYKGVPPFSETRDYVPIVLSYLHLVGTMCEGDSAPAVGCES